MSTQRRLADDNKIVLKGVVKSTKLWDYQYPSVLITLDVDGDVFSVKFSTNKEELLYSSHEMLVGKPVTLVAAFDSWEKEGVMSYGLKSYEKKIVMNRADVTTALNYVHVIATIMQKKPHKDGFMYQMKFGVMNPKTQAWSDKFLRMHSTKDMAENTKVMVNGSLAKDGDITYVAADEGYPVAIE